MPRTVVVGVGNTTRTDDGAGPRAVEALAGRLETLRRTGLPETTALREVHLRTATSGGLRLMEELVGFEQAVVLDAMQTGEHPVGTVALLRIADVTGSLHQASVHDMTLPAALDVGRAVGLDLPHDVVVLGIEVADTTTFGEDLTPAVASALPALVQAALNVIHPLLEMEPTCA